MRTEIAPFVGREHDERAAAPIRTEQCKMEQQAR